MTDRDFQDLQKVIQLIDREREEGRQQDTSVSFKLGFAESTLRAIFDLVEPIIKFEREN